MSVAFLHGIGSKAASGGGAELNIHYGTEAPSDTSKLWVETNTEQVSTLVGTTFDSEQSLVNNFSALPTNTYGIAAAVVGTKVYLFGGYDGSTLSTINVFDTETNTIETLTTTLPGTGDHIAVGVVGTKVYLFNYTAIYVFDAETNTIETLSNSMPNGAGYRSAAVVGTKVYLFGGVYDGDQQKSIYAFNTETNTIETLSTTLPTALHGIAAAVVGTKVYLFGGRYSSAEKNTIYAFNTVTNTIETLSTTLPIYAYNIAAAVVGTKVYLFGGDDGSFEPYSTIIVFDAETNTAESHSIVLASGKCSIAVGVVGTKVYLFGGKEKYGSACSAIDKFTISAQLANNTTYLLASMTDNVFPLISGDTTVEIGVSAVYIGNSDGQAEQVNAYLCSESVETTNFYKYYCAETTAGTTLTSSVACSVGDLIIACIITRDTLTLSDGWTLISTSGINSNDTTNGQRLSFAYKYAESTTESITVTQASEQRLYINLVALEGATGFVDNGYHYDNNENSDTSSITVDRPSGLVLWACASLIWNSTAPYDVWAVSNNAHVLQLGTNTQSRLCTVLDQTDDETVTFKTESSIDGGTTLIVGSLTIQGLDKFYDTSTEYRWELI